MTAQHTLKRLIRARMSETGETYSTARRHFHVYERKRAMSQKLIDLCMSGANDSNLEKVRELVAAGADVNYRGNFGNTPLGTAAYSGSPETLMFLLDAGADPNRPCYEDGSPIGMAAFEGHPDAVAVLLDRGADPNVDNPATGVTPLHSALVKGGDASRSSVGLLLNAGADPNAVTKKEVETNAFAGKPYTNAESPLHWAAAYGDEETVRLLIQGGAKVEFQDGRGETPLQWAGRHQRPHEIYELLLTP